MAGPPHVSNAYIANQPYNQNDAFQPPHTNLLPANIDGTSGVIQLNHRPFELDSATYGNPLFLRSLSAFQLKPVNYLHNRQVWQYGNRHKAQAILPFLYLGPADIAKNMSFIRDNKISMVVSVRSIRSAAALPRWLDPARFESCANLVTATFDIDGPLDIMRGIGPIVKRMVDHLESSLARTPIASAEDIEARILVVCESGNERSPILVAAFLMVVFGFDWSEALNYIHCYRFSVGLTSAMNSTLITLEGMLRAQSDTARAVRDSSNQLVSGAQQHSIVRHAKRSIDDAYSSEEAVDLASEASERPGSTPFIDTLSSR